MYSNYFPIEVRHHFAHWIEEQSWYTIINMLNYLIQIPAIPLLRYLLCNNQVSEQVMTVV